MVATVDPGTEEMKHQTIIVMEGPDGCGKTNIGKALADEICVPYFKVETERRNWHAGEFVKALEHDQTYIVQFLEQTGHSVLIDRAWPSEYVYSRVFGRQTNMDVLEEVDGRFAMLDAKIVLCLRNDYSVVQDDLVDSSRLMGIHDAYLDFARWTRCKVTHLYVDDGWKSQQEQVNNVICRAFR